ncbi:MAG: hypothetical protein ACOX80_02005 [Methanomassiliicoccaceae archaeon]|jgi:hypothetical protein|nr:hypothetical protein [Euryarchaeota archaeon]
MWEKIRYIFVALVVLAAAMSFVPWTAEAEPGDHFTSDYIYNKHGDTVEITKYIGDGIDVVIPSEIEGMPVTSLGDYAFYQCFDLISVTIPGSVTRIEMKPSLTANPSHP